MTQTTNNAQMRKGFTMIELIFVIVIIGILAAVAIPRLAATRDDAKVATALSETGMILREMTTYYTANGHFDNNRTSMSNIEALSDATGDVNAASGGVFTYQTPGNDGTPENCVIYTVKNTGGEVAITAAATPAGNVCIGLQASSTFSDNLKKVHKVGGSNVSF